METPGFDFAIENYPLAPATYYKVGGPARLALTPRNSDEAIAAYAWMLEQPGPRLILGAGSNVLIADEGFPGIVLFTTSLDQIETLDGDTYRAAAGVNLDRLVREVILPHNYEGAGALAGIPGSVGGAIFMNAGTVNGSTCQFLDSVGLASSRGPFSITPDPSHFGYRSQTFCPPDALILDGVFRFQRSSDDQTAIYNHYLERRREKQPQGRCCGSVFKNPGDDHAGRLIEACGLKGTRHGGAVISLVHANFIVNEDNATFDDISWLIDLCKRCVKEHFGIELQEEVRIIHGTHHPSR